MKTPLLHPDEVVNLIPQKAPFVMIGSLLESDDSSTLSNLEITEDNIFIVNGEFTEPGLVENIAQTGAIRAGYAFSKLLEANPDLEPPVGFIGAIKGLKISALPKIGDIIETMVTVENQVFDITMVKGEVRLNDEIIASCQMKIFVQNNTDTPA